MARGACKSIGGTTSLDGQAMIATLARKATAQPKLMDFHVRCRLNGAVLACSAVGVARSPAAEVRKRRRNRVFWFIALGLRTNLEFGRSA